MAPNKMLRIKVSLVFIVSIGITNTQAQDSCLTPNSEEATCVSLFSCPTLMKTLCTLEPSAITFFKQSLCNRNKFGDVVVCCGKVGPSTTATTVDSSTTTTMTLRSTTAQLPNHREFAKKELLPSLVYCGYQHTDDRFYKENATALDEFPWLAPLILTDETDDAPLIRCNGVLINDRYVLTVTRCLAYYPNTASIVRLGQHVTSKNVTCIENSFSPECNDPPIDVGIEEIIYRTGSATQTFYDFCLLRLNQTVTFTEYIRPICLPFEESTRPVTHQPLIFSGWGAFEREDVTKKRLIYKQVDHEECYKLDGNLKRLPENLTLICIKPDKTNTEFACFGDLGGPLMYTPQGRLQWFVEGLLIEFYDDSGSGSYCSNTHPLSGIKVTQNILDWILDNIRA